MTAEQFNARKADAHTLPDALDARVARAYDQHFEALSKYARFVSRGDDALAEDLVQGAFLALLKTAHAGRWPERMRAFLFCVVTRLQREGRQRAGRRDAAFQASYAALLRARESAHAPPDAEDIARLSQALDGLNCEQREALGLRIYAGLSFPEIAEVLEIPEKTADSRYRAALERLRQQMKVGEGRGP